MTTLEKRLAALEGRRRPDDDKPPEPFNMGGLWLGCIGRSKLPGGGSIRRCRTADCRPN
jgi:hypothetical protein